MIRVSFTKITLMALTVLLVSSSLVVIEEIYAARSPETPNFVDSFDVSGQDTGPRDVVFNSDGTKMFVVGREANEVNQYVCTTGFDVSTCSFTGAASNPFSINTQEAGPESFVFNTDGSKMFVVGSVGDEVNEYTLAAPFDITTAPVASVLKDVSGQSSGPTGLAFNSDGTKMFVAGSSTIFEYACTTGFLVTSCTVSAGESFSAAAQTTEVRDIEFNSDGTKMFHTTTVEDKVFEYSLGTGFDVSTASFVDSFDVSTQEADATGLTFNSDGTKMFLIGPTGDDVNEYTLEFPFDLLREFTSGGGDSSAPTMGTSSSGQRLIDNGFVYNNNPIDVENFKTHYPLVRTPVGEKNTLDLKVFENQGVNNILFVSVHFGVPQIKAQGEAIVTFYPETELMKVHDPNNLLGDVNFELSPVKCKANDDQESCIKVSLDHTFNEAPMHDIVRVTLTDKTRNHSDVFFNDGVEVFGDSLNPANTAQIAAQGKNRGTVELTQTDRAQEIWVDQYDNTWTKNSLGNFFQVTPDKYSIVNDDSISSHGYDRAQSIFRAYMDGQELYAMQVWDGALVQSEIKGYIPGATITDTLRINDPILQSEIISQIQLAELQWDSQIIQSIVDDYTITQYTAQEYGITDVELRIEIQKAEQLLEELYYLNKINENGAIIQKSPTVQYKSMTHAKLSDESMYDAKLSEHDKAKALLHAMYGLE